MTVSSVIANEDERIASLYQLQIIDTRAEEDFDDIVALAAQICETPIATIAFEDKNRFWFKAKYGIELKEVPRDNAFCSVHSLQEDLLIIRDTMEEGLFVNNPLVTGKSKVRFFAGVSLVNEEGFRLGFLCVMDHNRRSISDAQISGLRILARQVVILLTLRLQILKLKIAEEASRNSEEQMNTIFHNALDAVVVMDDDGIITQWNPKAESIFGWTAREAIGRSFHDTILAERFRRGHIEKVKRFQANPDEVINETIEISALRKNNTEVDIAIGISPASIQGKNFFINFISDITDRKLATRKLDDQKAFYENILNKLPTDIAVFDPNHKYLFVNPGGIKDEELRKFIIGKDDFEYAEYRKRDKSVAYLRREQFEEVKHNGKEIRWEDTINDPDGNPITHLRRLFPVHDDNGNLTMVIGFGIDITDRKLMEIKQTAMLKQLSAQNVQLVDFCNIVSHNLRAPLVNMSMLVKFIEESDNDEEQKMLVSKINPVIENLNTTFNELVESIQIKQDLEIKSEKIALQDCLQRTLEVLELEISKSHAIIEANFAEAPVVYYPTKYLFSIFQNLISNALKYQSPDRTPEIKIETQRVDESIILSVKDNGLGIDLEKHKDNFFKIGKVFHRHPNAKGFGLFMTKTQVDAMDGRIWAESKPDEGSTFFIEFKNQKL